MSSFHYDKNELWVEDVRLADIAKQVGTPCYIYSRETLESNWRAFQSALTRIPHRICYAVKANSNLAILHLFKNLGAHFDIVSVGELERVLKIGASPQKIIFSGVGKSEAEIVRALQVGIYCFDVESEAELTRIQTLAERENKIATIALRINPNIDARTHPYISTGLHENKFGIEIAIALTLREKIRAMPNISLTGIACHIGSQLTEIGPFLEALSCLIDLAKEFSHSGFQIKTLNLGGGLGISYKDETPPSISDYAQAVQEKLRNSPYEICFEPGRVLVGNAGMLLTRVEYIKNNGHKNFAIVDAGMTELIRPALYEAWHDILPVHAKEKLQEKIYDIVGPVCESGDFLGKERKLKIEENDLLAISTAGAYGSSMSSNYNTRPRVVEVLVDKDRVHVIREREPLEQLWMNEKYEF